jgi:hypothetical protein
VFTLMPFDREFEDTYRLGIAPACELAGAYCERVDEQIFQESILQRIYNQIAKADLIVADMSGRNPNVFYEVGYAHALGKRVVLLTRNADDIPFDLKHYPHIVYGGQITTLRSELERRVKWFLDAAQAGDVDNLVSPDFYFSGTLLIADKETIIPLTIDDLRGSGFRFDLSAHNGSTQTYPGRQERLAIIGPAYLNLVGVDKEWSIQTTKLPDGKRLHYLGSLPAMLPDIWQPIEATGYFAGGEEVESIPVILRIFTPAGSTDYPLVINLPQ